MLLGSMYPNSIYFAPQYLYRDYLRPKYIILGLNNEQYL